MKDLDKIKLNYPYQYGELCRLLGEEEVNGNSKYAQFNNWDRYFAWHTEGKTRATRFIITKVYTEIKVQYVVEDKVFTNKQEADEYRKSL